MIGIDEIIKDFVDSGFTREEAIEEAHKELDKRKEIEKQDIVFQNNAANSYRDMIDRFKR